jgi:hypothetical protein
MPLFASAQSLSRATTPCRLSSASTGPVRCVHSRLSNRQRRGRGLQSNRNISGCLHLAIGLPQISRAQPETACINSLSEKLLIAIFLGFSARYSNVADSAPSRIIRCKTMSDLKTIVHVESRSRNCSVRKISATPASPLRVARRICSMYFDLGAASCKRKPVSPAQPKEPKTNVDLRGPFDRLLKVLRPSLGVCGG